MRKAVLFFLFTTVINLFSSRINALQAQVNLGEKVPNFTATNQDGKKWSLRNQLKESEYMVIYFYPAAFTAGCTQQACTYRDHKSELDTVRASVVGISADSPETLGQFALEHQLNFTLLSDEKGEIANLFGVPRNEGGIFQRWTFVLDRKGTMIYRDTNVKAAWDSSKVLVFLSSL
jgi:peroxiredoxin Q/BCP